ncbi:hypothetical protein VTO73DRAFT_1064 [Trametes versicolor]
MTPLSRSILRLKRRSATANVSSPGSNAFGPATPGQAARLAPGSSRETSFADHRHPDHVAEILIPPSFSGLTAFVCCGIVDQ